MGAAAAGLRWRYLRRAPTLRVASVSRLGGRAYSADAGIVREFPRGRAEILEVLAHGHQRPGYRGGSRDTSFRALRMGDGSPGRANEPSVAHIRHSDLF